MSDKEECFSLENYSDDICVIIDIWAIKQNVLLCETSWQCLCYNLNMSDKEEYFSLEKYPDNICVIIDIWVTKKKTSEILMLGSL